MHNGATPMMLRRRAWARQQRTRPPVTWPRDRIHPLQGCGWPGKDLRGIQAYSLSDLRITIYIYISIERPAIGAPPMQWNPPHAEKSTGLASLGERKGQIAKGEGRTPPAPSQSRDGLAHFTGRSLCKFTTRRTRRTRSRAAKREELRAPEGALGGALGGGPKRRGGRGRPSAPARPPARAAARLEAAGVRGARRGGRRRHRAPRRPPPLPGGHAPKGDGARPAPPGGLLDGVAGWRGASERGGQQGGRRGPGAPEDEREEEGEEEGEGEKERRRTEGGKS
ncbi:unnamed protein product [Prorocentrum cordatum]|uniref:Uncharacterized protein n=1 Tax=Prorocentrum cordatum TaxID=2364126 RepID=A0ABN9SL78_9DINO|nr:unnamed protein product [Polarella glacialis]